MKHEMRFRLPGCWDLGSRKTSGQRFLGSAGSGLESLGDTGGGKGGVINEKRTREGGKC